MTDVKFKEGDKVRVNSANFEGYIVKIYFESKFNAEAYVVCQVELDAPPFEGKDDINAALDYIQNVSKNIKTKLKCITVKLDSEDEMEKI